MYLKLIILVCLTTTVFSAPVDNTINSKEVDTVVDNDLKAPVSVDQVLNVPSKVVKLVEDTTPNSQLFNNEPIDEDKLFKLNDDLIDTSYQAPAASKQTNQQAGLPNVQGLIDQTNTISSNLENMIKDMTQNKRHATATMLRLMHQNVRRLNTSLVRLNNRVNSLPMIGGSPASATLSSGSSPSSAASAGSSISNTVSNATMNAASQINNVVTNIRHQLNSASNEINNLLLRIRQSMPGSGTPANKPSTPSG